MLDETKAGPPEKAPEQYIAWGHNKDLKLVRKPTEQLSADQAILGAAEAETGRYRESDAGALRESADDMNDDLKQHLRQRHISRQGIENLLNAGVHHLSDLRYLDPPDIASLGMSLVDRKKLEKLLHELEESVHDS